LKRVAGELLACRLRRRLVTRQRGVEIAALVVRLAQHEHNTGAPPDNAGARRPLGAALEKYSSPPAITLI
jgi:hypothetical protein